MAAIFVHYQTVFTEDFQVELTDQYPCSIQIQTQLQHQHNTTPT